MILKRSSSKQSRTTGKFDLKFNRKNSLLKELNKTFDKEFNS